jgi:hypothetical protein
VKRYLPLLLIPSLLSLPASADKLSEVDVQLLLEKLEALKKGEKTRSGSRLGTARGAFESALRSDDAAHELYLMCVEKVRFDDEQLSAQAFREWKRRHKDREDTPEFRRGLRHQLYWLTLTLEAAEADNITELGSKALARLDAILADAEELKGQQGLLRKNVLQTVFATAYNLGGLEVNENWPTAPLMLPEIYDQVILPPLRQPNKLSDLRSAWMKRILHEGALADSWGREGNRGSVGVDMARFLSEKRPELQWQMEKDLFKAGDQRGAALRMLAHIEKYLGHKNEAKWIGDFEDLVSGKSDEEAVTDVGE